MVRLNTTDRRLAVLNGAHKGAVIRLSGSKIVVGGSDTCNAVLSDKSANNASVCILTDDTGQVLVSDCVGDVRVGSKALSSNRSIRLAPGVPLYVGDVKLAVGDSETDATAQMSSRNHNSMLLRWGAGAALALVFSGVIGMTSGVAKAYLPKAPITSVPSYVALTKDRTGSIAADLEDKMLGMGMNNLLVDKYPAQKLVLVSGVLPSSAETDWKQVTRWFDGKYGTQIALQSNIRFEDQSIVMPFSIKSVVLSPWPHVVLHDGKQVELGMSVPGGWVVDGINETHISFVKGSEALVVKY